MLDLYPCTVVVNDIEDEDIPIPGCIKVKGMLFDGEINQFPIVGKTSALSSMITSQWIFPLVMHPCDIYIPELGETVYVSRYGNNDYIWMGSHLSFDFENEIQALMAVTDPTINSAKTGFSPKLEEVTDRIFGTRNGSYIKMEDKVDGKIIIEVMGSMTTVDTRSGCKVIFDGSSSTPGISIIAQNSASGSIITVDFLPALGKFSLLTADACKVEVLPAGITVIDKNVNKIEMTSAGIKLTDKNTCTIAMTSAGVDINGGKLTVAK